MRFYHFVIMLYARYCPHNRWMQVPAPPVTAAPVSQLIPAHNSLSAYLTSPVLNKDDIERMGGIMAYWTAEKGRGCRFADMALDILTAPGTWYSP